MADGAGEGPAPGAASASWLGNPLLTKTSPRLSAAVAAAAAARGEGPLLTPAESPAPEAREGGATIELSATPRPAVAAAGAGAAGAGNGSPAPNVTAPGGLGNLLKKMRGSVTAGRSGSVTEKPATGLAYMDLSVPSPTGGLAKGIPARELLQAMFVIKRERTLREASLFLVYVLIFCGVTTALFDVHESFGTNTALQDLFLDEEFPGAQYKKNFFDVMTPSEMWTWIQEPLLSGAYPLENYNGDELTEDQSHKVLGNLRLFGGVELRQLRVSNASCSLSPEARVFTDTCYAPFSGATEDRSPFGPDGEFTWSSGHSYLEGLVGFGPVYGYGGYVETLSMNATEAAERVAYLFANGWTDTSTRAVSVTVNLFNAQTFLFSTMRVLFEFFPTANLVKSYKIYTFRAQLYEEDVDRARAAGEIFLFIGWVAFVLHEVRKAILARGFYKYLKQLGNLYELVLLVLLAAVALYWLLFVTDPIRTKLLASPDTFTDVFEFSERFIYVFTVTGFLGLLLILKLFKFFSISKQMKSLWFTLQRAAPELVSFGVGFCVLVAGFSFMAGMLFGSTVEDFHNFPSSFSTLLRFPLGDFNYQALAMARPLVTGWFFALYFAMVLLIAFNVLIGIVTMYFEEVSTALKTDDPWQRSAPTALMRLNSCLCNCLRRPACQCRRMAPEKEAELTQLRMDEQKWAAFETQLKRCMDLSEFSNNLDLFEYVDKLYRSRRMNENVYVSLEELQRILRPNSLSDDDDDNNNNSSSRGGVTRDDAGAIKRADIPCAKVLCFFNRFHGNDDEDDATYLVRLYASIKNVILLGNATRNDDQRHQARRVPRTAALPEVGAGGKRNLAAIARAAIANKVVQAAMSDSRKYYYVQKVNKRGIVQMRQLVLEDRNPERMYLLNYDRLGRLRKSLAMSQLLQVELSRSNPRRLTLVFVESDEYAVVPERVLFGERATDPRSGLGAGNDAVYIMDFEYKHDGSCLREEFVEDVKAMYQRMCVALEARASIVVPGFQPTFQVQAASSSSSSSSSSTSSSGTASGGGEAGGAGGGGGSASAIPTLSSRSGDPEELQLRDLQAQLRMQREQTQRLETAVDAILRRRIALASPLG